MVRRKSGTGRNGTGRAPDAAAIPAVAVGWDDLSTEERTALKRMNRGPYSGLADGVAEQLIALGLATRREGGVGISRAGRELVIATLLAARDGAAPETT